MRIIAIIMAVFMSLPGYSQRIKQLGQPNLHYYLPFILADTVKVKSLASGGTAPTTTGTTKMVVTDGAGQLSFDDIPGGGSLTSLDIQQPRTAVHHRQTFILKPLRRINYQLTATHYTSRLPAFILTQQLHWISV
jgi:hypothetical protein